MGESERFQSVQRIFRDAAPLDPAARQALLDETCGDDRALRQEVESLLEVHDEPTADFLEEPALKAASQIAPPAPERIGRYRILQALGEGGFAFVYLAEQLEPVRRKVALKIIKPGLDTRQVIARFEAERQALALMDHPNVAKVFDAGATDTGRPYFVMELVKGIPITDYCDKHNLSTVERLNLIIDVCHAVQHAHQKGIIHRDIKPSNVLVTLPEGAPVPKVIDFGIAKATSQRLTDKTVFTELRQFIGTPAYTSPEQAEAGELDVDTRADIYSLGVLLYELLTGTTPFAPERLRSAAYGELQRIIREEEPHKPSTRMSSITKGADAQTSAQEIATHRRTDPSSLTRSLRGDLDWIVMKAMEKDRTRRYETASALALDMRRHLNHEPVTASPPSAAYRFRKFARRNRAALITLGSIAAALLLGLTLAVYGFIVASRERDEREAARAEAVRALEREQAAREESEAVTKFLSDMLAAVNPAQEGRDVLVGDVLDEAAREIGTKFGEHPLVEARLRNTIGLTYRSLGMYEKAESQSLLAVEIRRRLLGEEHPDTLRSRSNLALLYVNQGRYDEAEPLRLQTLELQQRVLGEEHPDTITSMHNLAILYREQARYDEAGVLCRQTLELQQRVLGEEHPDTLKSMHNLAILYQDQGRSEEAESLYLKTLQLERRVLGEEHPVTLNSMTSLANLYRSRERYDAAEALFLQAAETRRRVLGDEHPETLTSTGSLANLYLSQGRYEEAEPLYLQTLQIQKRVVGEEHPHTLIAMNNLAELYYRQSRYDDAAALFQETVAGARRAWPQRHPVIGAFQEGYGKALMKLERYEDAETQLLEAHDFVVTGLGPDHEWTAKLIEALADLYDAWGKPEEAAVWRAKLSSSDE